MSLDSLSSSAAAAGAAMDNVKKSGAAMDDVKKSGAAMDDVKKSGAAMDDVKKSGYLRKQKSMRKRYFVLRGAGPRGPARLEYYENEKKFRGADGSGGPRGAVNLEEAFGVNKRADAKRRHLLVMYTRDGGLCVSVDGEEEQEAWYQAILELQAQARSLSTSSTDASTWPVPPFREVWQVSVRPRGLGQTRNLSGTYRLCLTDRTLSLLRLRCDNPSVTLQLMNVRRCGHSDNYFFVEVGRSAVTGPGELWMQVDDSVVAQNMHETILEAMKSLSEEFRPRTKSQSLSSTPITVPSRRHLPNPPPPSQVGLSRRSRIDVSMDSSPAPKPSSLPRDHSPRSPEEEDKRPRVEAAQPSLDYGSASSDEYGSSPSMHEPIFLPPSPVTGETNYISMGQLGRRSLALDLVSVPVTPNEEDGGKAFKMEHEDDYAMMGRSERRPEAGYMPMLPGTRSQDYMPMTPNSISPPAPIELAGYVMMSPLGSCSPEQERISWPPSGDLSVGSADSQASDYMNMWPLSRSASSTPPPMDNSLTLSNGPSRIPASYRSLPRSYKLDPVPPGQNSCSSSSDSLEEVSGGRSRRPLSMSVDTWRANTLPGNYRRPPSPGEYVSINFRAKPEKMRKDSAPRGEYIAMDTRHQEVANGDYTKMTFEPETGRSQVAKQKVEKVLRSESLSGLVAAETSSRLASKKASWPTLTLEKGRKPSSEKDPMAVRETIFRPSAASENHLFRPSTASENLFRPSTICENLFRPSTASENQFRPSTASENLFRPSTASENLFRPSTASENLFRPSTASENLFRPSTASENLFRTSTASENLFRPSTASENLFRPSTASENLCRPIVAGENLCRPIVAGENLCRPIVAGENLCRPIVAGENLCRPIVASENLFRPSTASENLFRPSTASENPCRPIVAGENICRPIVAAENLFRPSTAKENLFRPSTASENPCRPIVAGENLIRPIVAGENLSRPIATGENLFRPIVPADNKLSLTAKKPTEAQVDSVLGLAEKSFVAKPISEDLELKGLLAAVASCGLYNGQDRKFVRADHPARTRHCSDNVPLNAGASYNGKRTQSKESGLNYIDLDLAKDVGTGPPTAYLVSANVPQPMKSGTLGASQCINTYASIDFQMSGELRRGSRDGTEC